MRLRCRPRVRASLARRRVCGCRARIGPPTPQIKARWLVRQLLVDDETRERVERLEIPWTRAGVDPYGISREHVAQAFAILKLFYRHYFTVNTYGISGVPKRGRAMLVGNHSGGIAL